jgi:hypothetical protein
LNLKQPTARHGLAGILMALIVFALIFTAGLSYFLFQAQSDMTNYQANVNADSASAQASQEQLNFLATPSGGSLAVTVNDSGPFPLSIVSVYVEDSTGKVSSPGVVSLAAPINLNVGGTNANSPYVIPGYSYSPGSIVYVSLVTSRGNVFTTQYPLSITVTTATIVSATTITTKGAGAGGGNSLVVVMSASPIQVFSGNTITDNVTVFNYAGQPMTGTTLSPSTPMSAVTGTATLTSQSCTGPFTHGGVSDPSGTIAAYSGSGTAPILYYLCTYKANSGAVGGLASFSGAAYATQAGSTVYSASVTSNLVQIGGLTNAIAQGAFSTNFFFYKITSCTNKPSGSSGSGYTYSSPCTKNTSPIPPSVPTNLPQATVISAGSNYYAAFYIQITNNFNTTLPILQYTYFQTEPSAASESDWWIAGTNSSMVNGAYYPNYACSSGCTSDIPVLTAYPTDCGTVNSANKPTDPNCIYVNPGQTVTITLAACGPGSSGWDWGGSQYGNSFDHGASCTSSTPSIGSGGSADEEIDVISFEYKGLTLTQDIAFQGVAFTA